MRTQTGRSVLSFAPGPCCTEVVKEVAVIGKARSCRRCCSCQVACRGELCSSRGMCMHGGRYYDGFHLCSRNVRGRQYLVWRTRCSRCRHGSAAGISERLASARNNLRSTLSVRTPPACNEIPPVVILQDSNQFSQISRSTRPEVFQDHEGTCSHLDPHSRVTPQPSMNFAL